MDDAQPDPLTTLAPAVPLPPIGPADLNLPPPPDPNAYGLPALRAQALGPAAPPQDDALGRILKVIALGAASALGPGRGTGILQGVQAHTEAQQRRAVQEQTQAQRIYGIMQSDFEQATAAYQRDANQRQAIVQQNLTALRQAAAKAETKDEYDQYVDAFGRGLQAMGFRLTANWLRAQVPYIAPTAEAKATKALEAYFKNPMNQGTIEQIQQHPELLEKISVEFDRDGDGTPELVPLLELAKIAKHPVGVGPDGQLMVYPKGTTTDDKANADGLLQSLIEQDKVEGKAQTPARMIELQQRAIALAADAKPAPEKTPPRDRYSVQPITNADGTTSLMRVNLETGAAEPVALPAGVAGTGKPNESERTSKAYLDRAVPADVNAKRFEAQLTQLGRQFDVRLPSVLQSEAGQRYRQARDEFINTALRRESGAAIQPSEYERYERIYFVMPGDTLATIRQKQQARERVIMGFRQASGNLANMTPPAAAPSEGEVWERDPVTGKMRPKRK